jgi:hypothetical protein
MSIVMLHPLTIYIDGNPAMPKQYEIKKLFVIWNFLRNTLRTNKKTITSRRGISSRQKW